VCVCVRACVRVCACSHSQVFEGEGQVTALYGIVLVKSGIVGWQAFVNILMHT
jgi:hypothetical protein